MQNSTFPVGQAPWETPGKTDGSFPVGQAPWENGGGDTPTSTTPADNRNILQKIGGAFVDPAVTLAARPGQAIGAGISHALSYVTGNPVYGERSDQMSNQPMQIPFFGTNVKPISQETPESVLGEGVSTVGLGLANPTAIGATLATGEAMQNNAGPIETVATGILGAIGGKLTDVAFQKVVAPVVSAAIEKFGAPMFDKIASIIPDAYKTSFQHLADAVSHVTPSTEGNIPIVSDIMQKGKNIISDVGDKISGASQGMRQSLLGTAYRDTAQKYVGASRMLHHMETNVGTDPIGVLSAYGKGVTIPQMEGGKINPNESIDFLKDQIGELSKIKTSAIQANNVGVPIEEIGAKSDKIIDDQNWSKMRKDQAKVQVQSIVGKMGESYPSGTIPLAETDTIKSEQAAMSKSYNNTGKEPFVYDAHAIVGKTARQIVEDRTNDAPTKALNKWIQSHYDAMDLLESLRGKAPHGGLLTQALHRLGGEAVGSVAGSMVGHPWLGAVTGHLGADAIDGILGANFISNPIKRSLIEGMQNADPEVIKAALKYLDDKAQQMTTQLSLPSPQSKLPPAPDQSGAMSLPAGQILDSHGNIIGYSSTGESAVQPGTRKLPVSLSPSEYPDRSYIQPKKLPVIEMGKKNLPAKSKLPTIKY